ncbi:hypothetical protein [Afipia sp. DC4300-2b1]|uniref:hypothetical protein n=1 Tax=Afipia sp. DC4300-2b1 TaxID=2804672 RepID=UPI003CF65E6D
MCNLDSIYALIVLESAALERQPLRLMQNGSRSDIPEGLAANSMTACIRALSQIGLFKALCDQTQDLATQT